MAQTQLFTVLPFLLWQGGGVLDLITLCLESFIFILITYYLSLSLWMKCNEMNPPYLLSLFLLSLSLSLDLVFCPWDLKKANHNPTHGRTFLPVLHFEAFGRLDRWLVSKWIFLSLHRFEVDEINVRTGTSSPITLISHSIGRILSLSGKV